MNDDCSLAQQFGDRVRLQRQALGWSLDDLAAKAGLSKTGLWETEKGRSMPGIDTALKVANALGVPVGSLIEGGRRREVWAMDAVVARKVEELYRLIHPEPKEDWPSGGPVPSKYHNSVNASRGNGDTEDES